MRSPYISAYLDCSTPLARGGILRLVRSVAILLTALAAGCGAAAGAEELTVMTFNIRSARGDGVRPEYARRHLDSIVKTIVDHEPDVVLLQELDRGVERTGRVDQFAELVDGTGMLGRFAHAVDYQGGEFGPAVLTSLPIVSYEHIVIPRWGGKEERALQRFRVRLPNGAEVDVYNTHIDPRAASRDRQIRRVLELTDGAGPAILGGDFNVLPAAAVISDVRARWIDGVVGAEHPTFPARAPAIRIDYLFYRGNVESLGVRTLDHGGASDHRALIGRFTVRAPTQELDSGTE